MVEPSAESDAGVVYDMIRERDHYRTSCLVAVDLIERGAGKIHGPRGNVTHVVLPVDRWRSIRAILQSEPRDKAPVARVECVGGWCGPWQDLGSGEECVDCGKTRDTTPVRGTEEDS